MSRPLKQHSFWKKYGFEIILITSVLFIIIFALFRKHKNGSWNKYIISYKDHGKDHGKDQGKEQGKDSKGEIECRRVLQKIFNRRFEKARPDFLRNPVTGNSFNLELDCFNFDIRLAVEYQGCQHYKYTPFFHKNNEAFLNQKYRDYIKKQMCKDNNITLIEVPYTVKINDIEKYLIKELKKTVV